MSWEDRAACAGIDIEWFPDDSDAEGIARCKAICAQCQVQPDCLSRTLAEERGSAYRVHGVLGGMSALERRRMYLARRRAAV